MAATKAAAGMVKIQAQTMLPATPQRTALAPEGGDEAGWGSGEAPAPEVVAGAAPAPRAGARGGADPEGGAGEGVGGRHGDAGGGGKKRGDGPAGLGAEAAHGLELGDLL